MHTIRKITIAASASALIGSTFVIAPAMATPGSGFTPSGIVVGHYGSIDVTSQSGSWESHITAHPDSDVGADRLTVAPGGVSGWHSHPSAVFVTVTQGSIIWYNGTNPICSRTTYTTGQSFIEQANVVHNVRNGSNSAPAEFVAIHINPTGTSGPAFRVDKPTPTNCRF